MKTIFVCNSCGKKYSLEGHCRTHTMTKHKSATYRREQMQFLQAYGFENPVKKKGAA